MEFINWVKRKMAQFALATATVEKQSFTQNKEDSLPSIGQIQSHKQGMLSDALIRGELTQEVKDLRWRTYKIMNASSNLKLVFDGHDENGEMINPRPQRKIINLNELKLDTHDDYEPLLVLYNHESTVSVVEAVDSPEFIKPEKPLNVIRDIRPRLEIEEYTKKLAIRKISDNNVLLEFYISKYPDVENKKTVFLLSELKKSVANPKSSDLLDIKGVSFTSFNTIGVEDYGLYHYDITGFDKIVEHNQYYVIKFRANVVIGGENIFDKFREADLDEKYKNKERK